MRKIINSTYITLDGVVENPHLWPAFSGGSSAEGEAIQMALLEQCDIVLMGRRTYDVFAPAWSAQSGGAYADRINSMHKLVASTTLTEPSWNNTEVVATGLEQRLRELKAEPGGDIVQYGFGAVTRLMLANGLLDELRLWIHPLFVEGSTDDLMFRPDAAATFALEGSQVLSNGIIVAGYSVVGAGRGRNS